MISSELHDTLNAHWTDLNGVKVPAHYGDTLKEHAWLRTTAGVLDLSYRSRICVVGADRTRFLNGQVTNNVAVLQPGSGCYAALITAKGKMVSDLHIHILTDEILLDFEPGLTQAITERLESYVIADDVQIVDVAPIYGLLSVQGPAAREVISQIDLGVPAPAENMGHVHNANSHWGEIYVVNQPRLNSSGFEIYVPANSLPALMEELHSAVRNLNGGLCGWEAMELARIEAGIPRFGADMDSSNLPPEAGLESRAISYSKGCYIGQEVISRIRAYGQVAKALRGLHLADDLPQLPVRGDKLFNGEREAGYITSVISSPSLKANIALGYVRRECNEIGATLTLRTAAGHESKTKIVELPFSSIGRDLAPQVPD